MIFVKGKGAITGEKENKMKENEDRKKQVHNYKGCNTSFMQSYTNKDTRDSFNINNGSLVKSCKIITVISLTENCPVYFITLLDNMLHSFKSKMAPAIK